MLTWLHGFDMEARLLTQLVELKAEVGACIGKGLFSGGCRGCQFWQRLLFFKQARKGMCSQVGAVGV